MQTSDTIDKLGPALKEAQAGFRRVGKSGENTYDRYTYATLEDYVDAIREALANHGFSLLSSVEDVTRLDDRATKNGGVEHAVQVKLRVRLIHESGEWIEAYGFGEGQDRADKAIYKATTGARKYALASMLNLATTDDPERDETVGQSEGGKQNGNGKRRPFEAAKAKGANKAPESDGEADLSDPEQARETIRQAMAKKWDPEDAKAYFNTWLTDLGVKSGAETTVEQRRVFLDWIEGRRDRPLPDSYYTEKQEQTA